MLTLLLWDAAGGLQQQQAVAGDMLGVAKPDLPRLRGRELGERIQRRGAVTAPGAGGWGPGLRAAPAGPSLLPPSPLGTPPRLTSRRNVRIWSLAGRLLPISCCSASASSASALILLG